MDVKQIYTLVNDTLGECLGETALVKDDLSNLVDVGKLVFDNNSFDAFTGKLVDKVGKMVFVSRKYTGYGYSLMMDGWEYGCVLQKVSSEIPAAKSVDSYNLQNGSSYDQQVFYGTDVDVKFYNKYVTFEVDKSITERQLKSAFNSAGEMNAFLTMIFNEIDKAFSVALANLARGTVNNAIAETMYDAYQSGTVFTGASHTNAINLLYEYNAGPGAVLTDPLTAAQALSDVDFLKFAAKRIKETSDRMTEISTLFNVGGKERFTPKEDQKLILLSEFRSASDTYLQSTTFHNELTALPGSETATYWQGSGTDYALSSTGKIYCKTTGNHDVTATGILGVLFDKYAIGINSMERWVRTAQNAKADFTNYFYRMKAQYFNDLNENVVVFFIA